MNELNESFEALPPELAALDAGLAELGAAERAGAPAGLEAKIIAATAGTLASPIRAQPALKIAGREPKGLLHRLSVKRLDWPMRAAAVIAVMIGGFAVYNGANGPGSINRGPKQIVGSEEDAERLLSIWSSLEKGTTAEKIQGLLLDAANLETMVGEDDFGVPDFTDQENI